VLPGGDAGQGIGQEAEVEIGRSVTTQGQPVLWLLTALISGRAEAWDAPMYWTVTYPLAILLAGVLGYRAPRRAWRWGLLVMLVQAPVLLLTSGSSLNLLPLGLVLFAILALPPIVAARFAAGRRMASGWREG